jgi:hypothetical protein
MLVSGDPRSKENSIRRSFAVESHFAPQLFSLSYTSITTATGHKVLAYFFSSLVCIFNFKIHLHWKPFCILISRGNLSSKKIFPRFSSHYTRILPPIIYIIKFLPGKNSLFLFLSTELLCYSSPVLPLILFSRFFLKRLYRFHLLKKRKREKNINKCYILVYIALYSINIIY